MAELKAMSWLLDQGYEVYRNVSPEGPFDLIAIKPDETVYIDVKTCSAQWNYDIKGLVANKARPSANKYKDLNKKLLYVYQDHVAWRIGDIPYQPEFRQYERISANTYA